MKTNTLKLNWAPYKHGACSEGFKGHIGGRPETTGVLIYDECDGEEKNFTLRGVCFADEFEHSEENSFPTVEAAQAFAQKALGEWVWGLLPRGLAVIGRERLRQLTVEGWSAEHDDAHDTGELAGAGACYALHAQAQVWPVGGRTYTATYKNGTPALWPWEKEWWEPVVKDPERNLAKAGALIAAELDRLGRLTAEAPSAKHQAPEKS